MLYGETFDDTDVVLSPFIDLNPIESVPCAIQHQRNDTDNAYENRPKKTKTDADDASNATKDSEPESNHGDEDVDQKSSTSQNSTKSTNVKRA